MEQDRGNGGLPYGSGPPKGIALRREGSRRGSHAVAAPSNPVDDEDDPDLAPSSSDDPQEQHNLRPRRRSKYSAADEALDQYSDAEYDDDDLGSGSLGRDESGRKKVGRPIAYKGDPNSPHLTEDERRRIKRRIANRESARRVRQKRQDVMEDLQVKINALQAQNQRLMAHVGEVEAHKGMLTGQVTTLRSKWSNATNDNMRLQAEVGTLRKTLQMQQANLEMLQRGAVGGPAPQQQQQSQQQQQPPQQQQPQPQPHPQPQQQQQLSQAPSSSPADMFNNLASMYGLPSAQHGGATVTTGGPADASAPMASGTASAASLPPASGQLSAFSNGGSSAFSPMAPLQGAGGSVGNAHSMGRQPSDTWNFLNAAVRMSSGSLGMGGLGTFGSEQLPDSLGMGGSSSALNIAALNPAGSGRLPDLSPIGRVSSGRLPELYAVSRGVDVSPALGGGVSRPPGLGSPPDLPLPGRRGSMQLGSPLGRPSEQQERPSPAAEAENTLNRTESHNGHRTPTPAKEEAPAEDDPDDMHPASALLFLKKSQSSELQGHHRRPQTASR